MSTGAYRVHVVLDPLYGHRVQTLPAGEPVWVVDSEANGPIVRALWPEHGPSDHLTGFTLFKVSPKSSPDDNLADILGTIDEHHGGHSHDPPYSVLHVIGAPLSDPVRDELRAKGFSDYETSQDGFLARKR